MSNWTTLILGVCTGLAATFTLLPFWKTSLGWVRIWDFPRLQIAIFAFVVGISALFFARAVADYYFIFLLLCVTGWQISFVWPYLPGTSQDIAACNDEISPNHVSLLTTNVLQSIRNADKLISIVRQVQPDVVLAVEVDDWWNGALNAGLLSSYPNNKSIPLSNGYGIAIFSRLQLESCEVRFIIDDAIPSIRATIKLRSGRDVTLFGLHPRPPALSQGSEQRDLELIEVAKEIRHLDRPIVVLGDLNDVAWSDTTSRFLKIGNLADPRRGRGLFSTYPARWPGFRYPLDYVFCSRHFRVCKMNVLSRFGSDHLPLVAEFQLSD